MENSQNKLRIRPRFRSEVNQKPDTIKAKMAEALQDNNAIRGEIVEHHVMLKMPVSRQHYWSPHLHLELEESETGTLIRGLFGPKPGVWTMFVFFYSAIGFLTMLGLLFGLSQMMLKMDAYGLYAVPVGSILLIGLFTISKVGQRLSYDQMRELRQFVDDIVKEENPKKL